jgi:glycosidase
LAFNFLIPGIPIVFYGTEAGLEKQNQPLWEDFDWDKSAPMFVNIKMLNW